MSQQLLTPIEKQAESPGKRRRIRLQLGVVLGLLIIAVSTGFYLGSDHFQEQVRRKVVSELEHVTGGRVELSSFTWKLSNLEFIAENLTIHGLEGPHEMPYAHVDHLNVRVKILSIFGGEIGLRYVGAQHPVIHIIVNPDGSTNQPKPKIRQNTGRSSIDRLFDLAIDRVDIRDGLLIWNDKHLPLNFNAENVSAQMTYALLHDRYDGIISVGGSLASYGDFRPLPSNAEVQFSLINKEAEIKSFKWSSPSSHLEASGRVTNFANPEIELSYNGKLNLAELGSTVRLPSLRAGTADVQGTGSFALGGYSSSGKLVINDLAWRNGSISISGVNAGSRFSLDQNKLSLTNINAHLLGGAAQGQAAVQSWSNFKTQRGSAGLRVSGMQIARLAEALSSPRLPLAKLNVYGITAGTVGLAWKGSLENAEAALDLSVSPPANPPASALPITARLRGSYLLSKEVLEIADLYLATPAMRVTASGTLGSESAQLTLSAQTANLHEWDPLLKGFGESTQMPIDLQGRAAFTGTVAGKFALPTIRGHIELAAFDSLFSPGTHSGFVASSSPQPPKRIHWDSLTGDVQYSPKFISVVNGMLRRGSAQISISGRSTLLKGRFDDSSAFIAQLQVRDAAINDLQSAAGTSYPVNGTLNLSANASGTINDLRGNGRFQITSGTAYREPFRSLRLDIRFAGHEAQFTNISLSQNGAQITGSAAYNLTSEAFHFDLHGENIDLAHIQSLQHPRISVAGRARFQASGSGTKQTPIINANVVVTELVVNGEAMGDLTANAVTRGRELQLTASSQFNGADLTGNGTVQLTGDFPGKIELNFSKLDFDPALRAYLGGRVSGHSSANGKIVAEGPLRQPKLLRISGTVSELSAEIEKIRLRNQGPVVFGIDNETFHLESSHITGDGTDLVAQGTVGLAREHQLRARADGRANLKLFQSLSPGLLTYGDTSMEVTAGGTIANPSFVGRVNIENAGVTFIDLPNGLSDINGTLVFNENRLQIRSLTARTGGGTLNVGGFITYRSGLFFNLNATGQEIRLRYPPGISAVANADLRLSGTLQSALLSGDVLVTRFGVNPKFDFALYLARSKQVTTAPKINSVVDNLRLDVHVTSTPELQVETSLAKIAGDADLRLRGSLARPAVLGRVNIVEGDVFFSGTKYHLERGDITFTNPVRIEPILNIEASARVREYDITLGFHGSVDKLGTTYRSEPPLPTADIIALLALGRTREDTALNQPTTQSFSDTASNAILSQALNAAISSRVQKLFGVSRIKIDPQVGGPENNPNARLTIEQQVNNNITLTYITNLASSAQQIIQVEYNVNRNLSIVAVRDQNGVLGFDVRVRQRKK